MNAVLILGASSDIANAIARQFAKNKFTMILAGRNIDRLDRVKKDFEIRYGIPVFLAEFDAGKFDTHAAFYKGLPLHPSVTVCVFGYLGEQAAAQNNWKESNQIIDANYTGAVSILNIVAEDYEKRKHGDIIGISSVAGERGRQSNYIYGSAKAGFTAYLSGLRNRLFQTGVHVMTVKPGFVRTKMTEGLPLPKPLTADPEQVGKAVYNAYLRKKNTVYVLWMWQWIMLIIKLIPEPIFKKLKL
jgi:decaprenylphospho-beta-D-erythro-pentofuranosid-2-ulose 2-reductase